MPPSQRTLDFRRAFLPRAATAPRWASPPQAAIDPCWASSPRVALGLWQVLAPRGVRLPRGTPAPSAVRALPGTSTLPAAPAPQKTPFPPRRAARLGIARALRQGLLRGRTLSLRPQMTRGPSVANAERRGMSERTMFHVKHSFAIRAAKARLRHVMAAGGLMIPRVPLRVNSRVFHVKHSYGIFRTRASTT